LRPIIRDSAARLAFLAAASSVNLSRGSMGEFLSCLMISTYTKDFS
jgi:hypothetical protein